MTSIRPPTLPRHFFRATLQDARPASETPQRPPKDHQEVEELQNCSDLIYDSEEDDWFEEVVIPSIAAPARMSVRPPTQELEELGTPSAGASSMVREVEELASAGHPLTVTPPTQEVEELVSLSVQGSTSLPRHFFRTTLQDGQLYYNRPQDRRHQLNQDSPFNHGDHPLAHFVYSTEESVDLKEAEEDFNDQVENVLRQIDMLDFSEVHPLRLGPERRHFFEEQHLLSANDHVDEEDIEDTENAEGTEATEEAENTNSTHDIEDMEDIADTENSEDWEDSEDSEYTVDSEDSDREEAGDLTRPSGGICCDIEIFYSDDSDDEGEDREDDSINTDVYSSGETTNSEDSECEENSENFDDSENSEDLEDSVSSEDPEDLEDSETSDDSGEVVEAYPLTQLLRQSTPSSVLATVALAATGGLLRVSLHHYSKEQLEGLVLLLLVVILGLVLRLLQLVPKTSTRRSVV